MCLTLTCCPEAHGAQRSTSIVDWHQKQAIKHFVPFGVYFGQFQGVVSSQWSVSWDCGTVQTPYNHLSIIFPLCSEHQLFIISPPLDWQIIKTQWFMVKTGQQNGASHNSKDTLLLWKIKTNKKMTEQSEKTTYRLMKGVWSGWRACSQNSCTDFLFDFLFVISLFVRTEELSYLMKCRAWRS